MRVDVTDFRPRTSFRRRVGCRRVASAVGGIEPVGLEVEMQRSYLDYAMSVIVGRALPDVRDGLKPVHRKILYAMYDGGYRPDRGYVKCARVVGDVMGQLPPARRRVDLRRPGPDGADLVAALPADRRQRQLRLAGQRPRRRHAVHRVAARPARHGDAAGHRRGHRRLRPQLRRPGQEPTILPSRIPNLLVNGSRRHRGRHGDQDPAAQPAGDRRRPSSGAWTTRRPTRPRRSTS